MTDKQTLETKSAPEVGPVVDEMMRAFETFKAQNDRRLADIERRGAADTVTLDHLARLDGVLDDQKRRLDEMTLKAHRPHLGTDAPRSHADLQVKAAFDGYMRQGDARPLAALEGKSLAIGTNAQGGYLVPPETEAAVMIALRAISPIRAIAGNRQVSSAVYKKPFSFSGIGNGWVGETAPRPESTPPTLDALTFPTMELYAMPAATSALLDDSIVNIDQWLAEEIREAFAQQEGAAFVNGDGVNKPKGFLAYPTVANASWTWGNVGTLSTGVAGAFPATNPADKLIDLAFSVKAGYRANGSFVMNRATQAAIRKFKDAQGHYIWEPAPRPGEYPSLLGYPVVEAEDMPDMAPDSVSVAFGDFRRGYLVVDRVGIRVLRDPYSSKPYVLFYTTKRVGGGIQDFNAIKLLKFGV